ncbi:MAG: hypothetical protein LLG09_03880 [Negativicutes bacterium]|nr:hypothetical protein [Negativicutes bacterium]
MQKKKADNTAHWKVFSGKEKIAYNSNLSLEDAKCALYWYIREIDVNE